MKLGVPPIGCADGEERSIFRRRQRRRRKMNNIHDKYIHMFTDCKVEAEAVATRQRIEVLLQVIEHLRAEVESCITVKSENVGLVSSASPSVAEVEANTAITRIKVLSKVIEEAKAETEKYKKIVAETDLKNFVKKINEANVKAESEVEKCGKRRIAEVVAITAKARIEVLSQVAEQAIEEAEKWKIAARARNARVDAANA